MKLLFTSLACAALAAATPLANASVLFEDNWAGLSAGDYVNANGNWVVNMGIPSQLQVVTDPSDGVTGNYISGNYSTAGDHTQITSTETFVMPSGGIRLSFDVALENGNTNYFRMGIKSATDSNNFTNAYWLENWSYMIRPGKGVPTITNLTPYNYSQDEWTMGDIANVAMTIIPIEAGGYEIVMFLNGEQVGSPYLDASGAPDFSDGFKIVLSARAERGGYFGNVKLEAIPEGSSVALLAGGVGVLLFGKRFGKTILSSK